MNYAYTQYTNGVHIDIVLSIHDRRVPSPCVPSPDRPLSPRSVPGLRTLAVWSCSIPPAASTLLGWVLRNDNNAQSHKRRYYYLFSLKRVKYGSKKRCHTDTKILAATNANTSKRSINGFKRGLFPAVQQAAECFRDLCSNLVSLSSFRQ